MVNDMDSAKDSKIPLNPGYFKIEDDKYLENNNQYRKVLTVFSWKY